MDLMCFWTLQVQSNKKTVVKSQKTLAERWLSVCLEKGLIQITQGCEHYIFRYFASLDPFLCYAGLLLLKYVIW
jgi:hypothetical protein